MILSRSRVNPGHQPTRSCLVVDKSIITARAIERMLPADEVVFETDPLAGCGHMLRAESANSPFAVVLCDVGIDDQRGLDLLRTSRERRDPPLFLLMANEWEIVEAAWLADGVLVKPFSADDLFSTIARVMRRRSRAPTRRNMLSN